MPTVGETISKISELKSRWAILHELLVYLETHYKSSDAGPAEIRIHTTDYAAVPEIHIDAEISTIAHQMDQIKNELREWEMLTVEVPADEPEPAKKPTRKKRRAAKSKHPNRASPGNDGLGAGG